VLGVPQPVVMAECLRGKCSSETRISATYQFNGSNILTVFVSPDSAPRARSASRSTWPYSAT